MRSSGTMAGTTTEHTPSGDPAVSRQKKNSLFWTFYKYFIQHCFICRPSDSNVSEDARIEPRTVTTTKYVHIKSTMHSLCPSPELGLPPTPHPQASVPPPPCFWGEGNTRWRERGWESPNSDEGHTLWYSLYLRTLWLRL
jgi:hypothetical protein